jgi:phosphoribosylanthranilate isomerase
VIVRVKICGLTRREDAALAVRHGASAVGLVFWPSSPRAVSIDQARAISSEVPLFVARVGVFVDATPREVERIARAVGLDAVQLHGDEDLAEYASVAARVIKAVRLESAADVDRAAALPPAVTLLVDAADRAKRGGTGTVANWDLAAALAARRPIMLAGGLDATNVGRAIARVRPWAVDVSSGVEARPGVKSPARLAAFFAAVREAEQKAQGPGPGVRRPAPSA